MKPHSDRGRIYLNFPSLGEEGEELVRRSYGANFARLGEVKRKYDPLNVFRFNQNIKPGCSLGARLGTGSARAYASSAHRLPNRFHQIADRACGLTIK